MLIDIIAGARPNFVKIAPIISNIIKRRETGSLLKFRLIHTGQHYDKKLSGDFFTQLEIPAPDINLEVGSGTQAEQTATIMTRYEKILLSNPCSLCLVVGDVNSTMACAITAQKLRIPVGHVEAGIRSGDWSMPEEINRLATDAITNWFFTTSTTANNNLKASGVADERIFFVGNTMIDTLLLNLSRLKKPSFYDAYKLSPHQYFVLTLHRPANVDNKKNLLHIIKTISENTHSLPIVFPAHPRTKNILLNVSNLPSNLHLIDALPYLEFNYIVREAKAVITDSGGITEETTVLGVPCLTLRDNTERPETVTIGTNELIGTDLTRLPPALTQIFKGTWKKGAIPEKWDGHAGKRIVDALEKILINSK